MTVDIVIYIVIVYALILQFQDFFFVITINLTNFVK